MKEDFVNEMYKWALECMNYFNYFFKYYQLNIFYKAVGLVGLNTRLGCLESNLAPDSEAQRMIQSAHVSTTAMNKLEFGFPIWKIMMTPTLKKLYDAQDYFTEYNIPIYFLFFT